MALRAKYAGMTGLYPGARTARSHNPVRLLSEINRCLGAPRTCSQLRARKPDPWRTVENLPPEIAPSHSVDHGELCRTRGDGPNCGRRDAWNDIARKHQVSQVETDPHNDHHHTTNDHHHDHTTNDHTTNDHHHDHTTNDHHHNCASSHREPTDQQGSYLRVGDWRMAHQR